MQSMDFRPLLFLGGGKMGKLIALQFCLITFQWVMLLKTRSTVRVHHQAILKMFDREASRQGKIQKSFGKW
jgi:hypothetical protein